MITSSRSQLASGRWPARIRYILFALALILFLLTFFINLFVAGSFINLCLHSAAGVIMLIYVPASIILSVKNSPSRFSQAGGEVAYLVIQGLIWLASAILMACEAGLQYCEGWLLRDGYQNYYERCEGSMVGVTVLAFLNFALFFGQMGWLAWTVHHIANGRTARKEVYMVPTYRLLADPLRYRSSTAEAAKGFVPLREQV